VTCLQYVDNLPLTELSPEELDLLRDEAIAAGIQIEIGMRGTDAEGLRSHLALAKHFTSPFLRVMPDKGDDKPTPQEIVTRLRPMLGEFADAGVILALENHERIPVAHLRETVETLGTDTVRVCLDTTNSWGALETPQYVVETLAPLTINLHLKDFVVRRIPAQLGFVVEGVPTGQGVLDVPDIIRRLPADCSITHEQWTPFQVNIEETCALESRWTDDSIAYLHSLFANEG
jgi:3-oxoisoapionate decarboxylase